ncbi:Feruloyl esterase B [Marasmius sp. AFHP31]|nr:Feruloyl esterase B [Marasmius sp. AFHP31]
MKLQSLVYLATAAVGALGASLQQVTNWGANPTGIRMNIYVPDKLAANPAVIVALHGCGGTGEAYFTRTQVPKYADQNGFILIFPSTPNMSNCWDVNNPASLTHNAGGDALGIVNMVKYTLDKYKGDKSKVFVFGTSSGAMMTNVLAAVYPDVFVAGSAYSGTAHACFAGASSATPASANQTCAQGLTHTPQEWANFVRNSFPGYTGAYPKMQIWHGLADTLVKPACGQEALKQWSQVLGASHSKNNTGVPSSEYTQMVYGNGTKLQGYFGQGVGHTAPVNEQFMLRFFGLIE